MYETRTIDEMPDNNVQQTKEDWWKCVCGKYHKGFPYRCPLKSGIK